MRCTKLMTWTIGLGLIAGVAAPVLAQDAGGAPAGQPGGRGNRGQGGPGGPGGRMDPAQMREMRLNQIKEAMGASDEDWTALKPLVEKVQNLQFQSMMGRFGMGRGRNRGGDNAQPAGPSNPVADATRELQTVLDNTNSTPEQIKAKLTALRDARTKAQDELTAAQKQLREVVTVRQEAVLVEQGLLD